MISMWRYRREKTSPEPKNLTRTLPSARPLRRHVWEPPSGRALQTRCPCGRGMAGGCQVQRHQPQPGLPVTEHTRRDTLLWAVTAATDPAPLQSLEPSRYHVSLPGRCGVFLPPRLVHIHHTVRQVPSQPVCGGIPAGCSSWGISRSAASSRSHPCTQQSLPQHVDYRNLCYEECYAPTSSLCDTATELGSLPTNCL